MTYEEASLPGFFFVWRIKLSMSKEEKKKQYSRAYYLRTRDKYLARARAQKHDYPAEYRKRREKQLAYMKAKYPEYRANRLRRLQADPEYRAALNARGRAYHKTAVSILWRIRMRAKKKGLVFELTREWLQARLDAGVCELTGLPFTPQGLLAPAMPSVDRKDSSRGYTSDNCRLICWALNAAFNNWGEAEARKIWAEYLRRNP
jgi:hypothetical protein